MKKISVLVTLLVIALLVSSLAHAHAQTRMAAIGSNETLYLYDGNSLTSTNLVTALGAGYTPLGDAVAFDRNGDILVATEAGLFRSTPGSGLGITPSQSKLYNPLYPIRPRKP